MQDGKIEIFSNFFTVLPITPKMRWVVNEFARDFVQKELEKKYGKFRSVAKRVYARLSKRTGVIAFHINTYEDFKVFAEYRGIDFNHLPVVKKRMYKPTKIEMDTNEGVMPREDQVPIIDAVLNGGPQTAVTAQPGFGKAQTLSSMIKVPGGWRSMGRMSVGDTVVAQDGSHAKVTGVFPQGVTRVYRVHFADGRYTDCNPEHLWNIQIMSSENEQIVTTEDIRRRLALNNDRSKRISIPLCLPEDSPEIDYPIDPYLLGVILGDGNVTGNFCHISKPGSEIRELVLERLSGFQRIVETGDGMTFRINGNHSLTRKNYLVQDLQSIGLTGCRSWEKGIPEEYLCGSYQQRLDLLRGLLDTDGTIGKNGGVSYSSTSENLSLGVQYLVRSLGGIARITTRTPHFTHKGEYKAGRLDYRVHIRHPNPALLFTLPAKRERAEQPNQYSEHLRLRIVSIEERPSEPTQCIMIDHPSHLYVTDDFIVTHNTAISLFVIIALGERFMICTQGGYADRWATEFYKMTTIRPEEYFICCGFKPLVRFLTKYSKGEFQDFKGIFISITGMRDYIKHYESGKLKEYKHLPDIPPEKIYEFLGIGLKVVDEAHKEYHANFRADLYTHCPKVLYLTATLMNKDAFMTRMYETMLPTHSRVEAGKLNVYVEAYEVQYYLNEPDKAKYIGGMGTYSHTRYEQWLMSDEKRFTNYLRALYDYLLRVWILDKIEGERIVLWFATIEMVEQAVKYLKRRLPDMIINQFTAGDPYFILEDSDIIISTLGKSGTAVDISNLTQAHMTTSIMSWNANIQALGRLRELKVAPFDSIQTKFFYYVCQNIDKHVEYAHDKRRLFKSRITRLIETSLGQRI